MGSVKRGKRLKDKGERGPADTITFILSSYPFPIPWDQVPPSLTPIDQLPYSFFQLRRDKSAVAKAKAGQDGGQDGGQAAFKLLPLSNGCPSTMLAAP